MDDAATISPFWPGGTCGTILVTTQIATLTNLASVQIDLCPMKPAEGSALIRGYLLRGERQKEEAERLSRELGGHPHAIAHYAGYLGASHAPLQFLLDSLQHRKLSRHVWANGRVPSSSGSRPTLETMWNLAFTRLSENARKLLKFMSFLNPDSIPEEMFWDHKTSSGHGKWQGWDESR